MPLAGYMASRRQLTFWGVLLARTFGSLVGTFVWYAIGGWIGRDRLKRFAARHGRWLTLSPADIDRESAWFPNAAAPPSCSGGWYRAFAL